MSSHPHEAAPGNLNEEPATNAAPGRRPQRFAYGEIRQLLLQAIAEKPQHGYEIIRVIGERVGTGYRPSAGAVYPRLAKLTEERLLTRRVSGRTVIYTITELGLAEIADTSSVKEEEEPKTPKSDVYQETLDLLHLAVTRFSHQVHDTITRESIEIEPSAPTVHRLELELSRARTAIARLFARD